MTANEIRQKFLKFFESKGHKIVASDSLVPADDPTVLFTPAGMNQFKKQFLGKVSDFRRAATCQKCLRTDDLDKVGKTAFHHTFFEMLGNFSFGDYFKEEAISWAWEFLTKESKIPADKLWVSVYTGDDEAYSIWKDKIKIPEERIIKLGDKENFWPSEAKTKGPNGPCGPCSEIFFDYGKKVGCGKAACTPACDCGRFSEVWNLVFTQFNRKEGGALEPLPKKNIDTGMGLERLVAVMQGKLNNFETDLFVPISQSLMKEAEHLKAKVTKDWQATSGRQLVDHLRAIVFAISDGVMPSNEERGYVVRKLIRICTMLSKGIGINKPLLYKLVPAVAEVMKESYPELVKKREDIAQIIKREEEAFEKILKEREPQIIEEIKSLSEKVQDKKLLSEELGKLAFKAYDTLGVPIDLFQAWTKELDLPFASGATINVLMSEQKNRSKAASPMVGDVFSSSVMKLDLPVTEFVGYEVYNASAKILKIIQDATEVKEIKSGQEAKVILDKTPFYAEGGGQVGDTGTIIKEGAKIEVLDTQRIEKIIVHVSRVKEGSFKVGDRVQAMVDIERRLAIARNHTATHILQAVLRKVLGEHVQQQGSLVTQDKLRFDFTHFKDINKEQLNRIEELVNENIRRNDGLTSCEMSLEEAKKKGALAFFAEKYSERVKVVTVADYSAELCGGIHLSATGQIGLFKITSESAIAQGIRRIEAVTGQAAYQLISKREELLQDLAQALKVPEDKIVSQVQKLNVGLKELNKKLNDAKMEALKGSVTRIIEDSTKIGDVIIITQRFSDCEFDFLRNAVDLLKTKAKSAAIILGSTQMDKAFLVVSLTDDLVKNKWDSSEIIKEIAKIVGGTGGGRPQLAQAGGNIPAKLTEALNSAKEIIKNKYGKQP
ncbi:MAG: alanine--tRNA ligase [Candidatus Omnitrophota bacterium]|nr:alanine--tRNA ligase [Candidatus Omnitrophota bacterium]